MTSELHHIDKNQEEKIFRYIQANSGIVVMCSFS